MRVAAMASSLSLRLLVVSERSLVVVYLEYSSFFFHFSSAPESQRGVGRSSPHSTRPVHVHSAIKHHLHLLTLKLRDEAPVFDGKAIKTTPSQNRKYGLCNIVSIALSNNTGCSGIGRKTIAPHHEEKMLCPSMSSTVHLQGRNIKPSEPQDHMSSTASRQQRVRTHDCATKIRRGTSSAVRMAPSRTHTVHT